MVRLRGIDLPLVMMENGGDVQVKNKIKAESEGPDTISGGENGGKEKEDSQDWPPRFTKFELTFSSPGSCEPSIQFAFTDPRRLARVRLIEGVERDADLYSHNPLAELGPDYSKVDNPETHAVLSRQAFREFIGSRQAPIKSLLLNQAHFAGVGNWVLDEILFHAKVHPGQVMARMREEVDFEATSNRLYDVLIRVCQESVRLEGDLSKYPSDWLMLHRWGKRRQRGQIQTLADGRELEFATIGGRTSCFVPSVQTLRNMTTKIQEKSKKDVEPAKPGESDRTKKEVENDLRGETLLQDDEKTVLVWTLESMKIEKSPQLATAGAGASRARKRQTRSITYPQTSRGAPRTARKSRRLLNCKANGDTE